MIDTVFATDMAIHCDLLKSFNEKIDLEPDVNKWEDRNLLYMMVVHLADIGNPSRPFHLARAWAERVIQEFCEQVRTIETSVPVHKSFLYPYAWHFSACPCKLHAILMMHSWIFLCAG